MLNRQITPELRSKIIDFASASEQKQRVISTAQNFYTSWRENCRAVTVLREEGSLPPEKLLQAVWQHQRLRRDQLRTSDGQPVRIFHPGFASAEGGPDFRGAVIQIGDAPVAIGDVEIDLHCGGWRAHGHDRNPNFQSVILHVVWQAAETSDRARSQNAPLAVLPLNNCLDAPLPELALALETESGLPENLRGKCSSPLRELDAARLEQILHAAALVRLGNKAKGMLVRAKIVGWEQAFWEQLFRALGYKNNVWPMQNLAETRNRWMPQAASVLDTQARLLGLSGLLPDELTRAQKNSDTYLRQVWDVWWRERDGFQDCILPRAAWKFYGLRPANHPQRRLALASHWLAAGNLVEKIESWIATDLGRSCSLLPAGRKDTVIGAQRTARPANHALVDSLQKIFQVERDDYWSWHWTFKSARLIKPQLLLGEARVTDFAVNVVLPWLWIRAKEGGNEVIQAEIERRFLAWPSAEDNSILKLARQRLLGSSNPRVLKGAAQQQGLMQIVRDFCEHSNAICVDCRFPDLVRGWTASPVT